ncbi:MAG: NAD(P)/FAD-dependent oxidoreductase [Actinomycetota bacterium]|nr:NAD(P)/FAD-dependent oxidoreductase [Actinomycetota bacterium]
MTEAVVVGSGPNGLAAAVTLARQGVAVTVLEAADEIGGGTRTSDLTGHRALHDHCSAVHPLGVGSPFLNDIDAQRHGLVWRWPTIDLAHPLDDGTAGVMVQSLAATGRHLGADGRAWRDLFGPLTVAFDDLLEDLMRPVLHVPRHPVPLARFGVNALAPARVLARRFSTPQARGLLAGVAAHAFYPLERPTSSAVGLMLAAAGHRFGWPVAEGGSRAITDAMAKVLVDHGGRIETGVRVRSLAEVGPAAVTILDLAPSGVVEVAGDRLPAQVRRAFGAWKHGPAASKVDLVVDGGIPWTAEAARAAGTVHVGGTLEEIARAERDTWAGRMPDRPFVLVGQQYLADPTRSAGDLHPIWAYGHVPSGYTGDATGAILDQMERFAPGLRQRIVAVHTRSPAELAAGNPNYVGGDIITGANTARQVALRPRIALDPYSTGIPGVYLCSAATPPGAGAHGMCGYNAATRALRYLAS